METQDTIKERGGEGSTIRPNRNLCVLPDGFCSDGFDATTTKALTKQLQSRYILVMDHGLRQANMTYTRYRDGRSFQTTPSAWLGEFRVNLWGMQHGLDRAMVPNPKS